NGATGGARGSGTRLGENLADWWAGGLVGWWTGGLEAIATIGPMMNDPAALAEQLMAVDSTSGREGPAIDLLERLLGASAWRTMRIPVTSGRDDLYARPADRAAPITLSTHIDTVPPFIAPRRDKQRLYG